jgi:putative tryptophan/tyrosine transport system substrate-binding protein
MGKKALVGLLIGLALASVQLAEAQQVAKVPSIGFLHTGSASDPLAKLRLDTFRQGLSELGYTEGNNINIQHRYAEGRSERLKELAGELIRLKIDILVTGNATAARAAKAEAATVPIVVVNIGNLSGLVATLARPGGNVTGLTHYSRELLGKRLELLKEVVPKVSRFAFLNDSADMLKDAQVAAKALTVHFQLVEVKAPNPDFEGAFRVIVKERIGALVTEATPLFSFHRKRILELVEQHRIPAMHSEDEWAKAGGLKSYGANRIDPYRRVAVYVDKILKGAKPADLPVEQLTKREFVINLKAAKQIGLTIPPNVLVRADKVIK